jgi:hypothetical protein
MSDAARQRFVADMDAMIAQHGLSAAAVVDTGWGAAYHSSGFSNEGKEYL